MIENSEQSEHAMFFIGMSPTSLVIVVGINSKIV